MNTIYNAILANAIEGLRKKPVFIVHLLVSTAFGTLLLLAWQAVYEQHVRTLFFQL
ncbi:MAG: hypothetical protein QXE01_11680 [Sulfolobales archaeon]